MCLNLLKKTMNVEKLRTQVERFVLTYKYDKY